MEGMSCLEPLEQLVFNSSLVARPSKCITEERSDWKPVINPLPDITPDGRLKEANTYIEHSALGVSLDSGLMEGMSCLEPLEQSVLSLSLVARPSKGITEERSDWKPVINAVHYPGRSTYGLLTWSSRLWGCLWTVDSGRGCRA